MSRRKIIAGNWKMNVKPSETAALVKAVAEATKDFASVEVVCCTPAIDVPAAVAAAAGTQVGVGTENCHWEDHGAFTGEISTGMILDAGAKYVIVGHSERRQYHGEDDMLINAKAKALLEKGIMPIICVGESLEQREMDLTMEYVAYQVKAALSGIDASQLRRCVIAYEPIWAIGTGKTATAEQAQEVCEGIRAVIRGIYGARPARAVSILYGGSMNAKNARELLAQPDIDGGLIGGASLKPVDFATIIKATDQD